VSPRDIAVLYRANFQSRSIEEQFLYSGLPYQVLGTKFFDRKEIKDVLSYLRAALNPQSVVDMTRAVSAPNRGIGKMTLTKMLDGTEESLGPALQDKVRLFRNILTEIKYRAHNNKPSETLAHIIKASGMEKKYKDGTEEEKERLENLKELVSLATKYDLMEPMEGIEHILQDAALATDQDELVEDTNAVKLMTVHASKGLEFDYVFVTGLEEGLFPHEKMGDGDIDDEEERRLFYVAITRAGKKLYLTYATTRTIYGQQQVNLPSRFLNDLNPSYIEDARDTEASGGGSGKVDLIDF
jgi:DNA helicase-2/ATP-dependent DNA helicase PcrA